MFDFPGNPDIARIVHPMDHRGVIVAVCHAPAALLDMVLDDGHRCCKDAARPVSAMPKNCS